MLLLALFACGGPTIDEPDSGDPDPGDCESGLCAIDVSDTGYDCEGAGAGDPPQLEVQRTGSSVAVQHINYGMGCCPDFGVAAIANHRRGELEVSYSLDNDLCDCICVLDLHYTLVDVPSGSWTLVAGTERAQVEVP